MQDLGATRPGPSWHYASPRCRWDVRPSMKDLGPISTKSQLAIGLTYASETWEIDLPIRFTI